MADNLPVPTTDNEYIQIQPTTTELDPTHTRSALTRLHALLQPPETTLLEDLENLLTFSEPPQPILEVRLQRPDPDTDHLRYAATLHQAPHTSIDALETTLRTIFPEDYQLTRTNHVPQLPTDHSLAGVEYTGTTDKPRDWQTCLTPYTAPDEPDTINRPRTRHTQNQSPLTAIADTLASTPLPAIYQLLVQPLDDWSNEGAKHIAAIETNTGTVSKFLPTPEDTPAHREIELAEPADTRREHIRTRQAHRSFAINARVAIAAPQHDKATASHTVETLQPALGNVSGRFHRIEGQPTTDDHLRETIQTTEFHQPSYESTSRFRRSSPTSKGIVVDASELPHFLTIDGSELTTEAERALETVPDDRTAPARPPDRALEPFHTDGLTIGHARTADATPTDPIAIPPDQQTKHAAWFGTTGSGKSTGLINAIIDNHAATDGPEILIDRKGGRMTEEYLQSHYDRFGHLDDVHYFDCSEWLPALSFFDIRQELEAGVPREVAVEDRIGHFDELLAAVMGPDQYRSATRSPAVIKNVLEALYDPVHGTDVHTIDDLLGQLRRMHQRQTPPAVSDDNLQTRLEGDLPETDSKMFEKVMHGAKNRVEALAQSAHLRHLFQHAPEDEQAFDLRGVLDDDAVVIIDVGGLREEARRGITLVLLSQLWTALRRRHRRAEHRDHPLANLYLEEAADIASTDLLTQLLQQAREFDCAITLAMQFPGQLEATDADAYLELLNNVGTYVVGEVGLDHDLAHRLATSNADKEAVANRLRGLSPGEWLVSLPGQFYERNPAPFVCQSLPLPRGHPDSEHPDPEGFESARDRCRDRTRYQHAIELERPSIAETSTPDEDAPAALAPSKTPVLAWTTRMPDPVSYDPMSHALNCTACSARYDPTATGMEDAIECCHDLGAVDRDDVPVCQVTLKLDPEEIENSQYTPKQLAFCQVVYDAQQQRLPQLAYDIAHDSMTRLQEYVDIDDTAIDELEADGLLTMTDHPLRLYSVTDAGRAVLDEDYSYGSEYGHEVGDLDETSQHVCGVEVARRYFQDRVQDPSDPLASVHPYYELGEHQLSAASFMGDGDAVATETDDFDSHRLDLVGLDDDGEIILTVEVERINHDLRRAAPDDYDKMAACDPAEAVWVAMSHTEGHDILQALNDPLEGQPRVERTYADSTPVSQFRIDAPGFTQMHTIEQLRSSLAETPVKPG